MAVAVQAGHPYLAAVPIRCQPVRNHPSLPVAHGSARDLRISGVELLFAYSSPFTLIIDLKSSFHRVWHYLWRMFLAALYLVSDYKSLVRIWQVLAIVRLFTSYDDVRIVCAQILQTQISLIIDVVEISSAGING